MRLTRLRAFEARGARLKFPSRSWSGVRPDDGRVILAIRARDVRTDRHGSRCVVWSPHRGHASADPVSSEERLKHCELAERQGSAEGLLAYGEHGRVDPTVTLSLRVVKRGREYWAEVSP